MNDFRHLSSPPFAFTEHGAIMAANILSSKQAIEMSVFVVRAFIQLREFAITHKELIRKVAQLEQQYDSQFKVVFDAIKQLMTLPPRNQRKIGF